VIRRIGREVGRTVAVLALPLVAVALMAYGAHLTLVP
jgi:hypothetical protein